MPMAIRIFETAWLGSLAIGVLISALSFSESVPAGAEGYVLTIQGLTILIIAGLTLVTSRKRSRITKWILTGLFAVGCVFLVFQVGDYFRAPPFITVLYCVQFFAQCAGIYFLFTAEGRAWFEKPAAAEGAHASTPS